MRTVHNVTLYVLVKIVLWSLAQCEYRWWQYISNTRRIFSSVYADNVTKKHPASHFAHFPSQE
jgi:hypothetical protein